MSIVGEYWEEKIDKEYIQKPKDAITVSVMEDLKSRADRGLKKYNTTLEQNNKDDFMNHLYEELLDAAQYCKKELSFTKEIQKIIANTPNNQELGEAIRLIYGKK
jgi:hypothetical protein